MDRVKRRKPVRYPAYIRRFQAGILQKRINIFTHSHSEVSSYAFLISFILATCPTHRNARRVSILQIKL